MGIFAKGSQFPATVEADTPQNRYGGQFTNDSSAGDALGETLGEVNATAESANTTTGAIIDDIEALEGRVAALEGDTGPDLSGYATTASVEALEGRVAALEATTEVVTISGTGWWAHKQGRVVVLTVLGATSGWTLPAGWYPAVPTWAVAVGRADGVTSLARVGIGGTGTVTLADTTAPVFASVSYFVQP